MAKELRMTVDYDEKGDVLYVFKGKPYPTANYELDGNITLRIDSKTKQLVGLMIHNYTKWKPKGKGTADHGVIAKTSMTILKELLDHKKLKEPIVA